MLRNRLARGIRDGVATDPAAGSSRFGLAFAPAAAQLTGFRSSVLCQFGKGFAAAPMAVIRPHLNMGARMPPVSDKMLGIEASRGIAASAVVLYHSARHLDHIYGVPILMASLQFGHAGVDLFFVISGFIILYVHYFDIDQPSRISHYASRRFTRLMPTYWVALALTAAMSILAHGSLPSIAQSFWSVTLLPSAQPLILGIAWTLRHEVTFYLIFCILLLNRTIGLFAFAIWFVLSSARNRGIPRRG